MKKIKWTLGHIINFEYFLRQDAICNDENYLKKRDREIYSKDICSKLDGQENTHNSNIALRRNMLWMWLEVMKEKYGNVMPGISCENGAVPRDLSEEGVLPANLLPGNLLPGNLYEECLSLLRILFLIAGFMTGISICLTFFSYTGRQPLNVSYFLAITLFPQICLIMIFSGFFLVLKFNLINTSTFIPYPFLGVIIEKSLMAINAKALKKFSANRQQAFLSAIAVIREGQQVYGLLFFWPMFILMQLFGIAFNMGILVSTLFRILFFDTAFGWQSTLQVSAQMVTRMVEIVALPWSWLLPSGVGFPDLDQIIGSRIILKDGIYHLTTGNLVSWWPFMCLAILFYGLLPRIVMFFLGYFSLKRALEQQDFDHGNCSKLLRRMLYVNIEAKSPVASHSEVHRSPITYPSEVHRSPITYPSEVHQLPVVDYFEAKYPVAPFTTNITPLAPSVPTVAPSVPTVKHKFPVTPDIATTLPDSPPMHIKIKPNITIQQAGTPDIAVKVKPCIALVPDDIHDLIDKDAFIQLMKQIHGYDIKQTVIVGIDFDNEMGFIQNQYASFSKGKNIKGEKWSIVILQEAWQPPIRETLNFIKSVRKVLDKKTPIIIALTGKSELFTPLNFTPVDKNDWEIWKIKLSTIADPWLTMESLTGL
ncbi:MAG: DUF2868 domain-containing protein [Desulfamplus sp.]|nr:DUF2868 domain-containing protein [Desulfamplus sp.]